MSFFAETIRRFWISDDGPTTVEYALLLALIGVAVIVAQTQVGQTVREIFLAIAERLEEITG